MPQVRRWRPRSRHAYRLLATLMVLAVGLLAAPEGALAAVAPLHPSHAGGLSTGAIVLAVLAALVALGCGVWAAAHLSAFEPRWVRSARHALAESGFRASATWAEFTDWVRLGK